MSYVYTWLTVAHTTTRIPLFYVHLSTVTFHERTCSSSCAVELKIELANSFTYTCNRPQRIWLYSHILTLLAPFKTLRFETKQICWHQVSALQSLWAEPCPPPVCAVCCIKYRYYAALSERRRPSILVIMSLMMSFSPVFEAGHSIEMIWKHAPNGVYHVTLNQFKC